MGILDDAIREHLELKRSHGASEGEVRRQEAEVFGPPRQGVAAPEPEGDRDDHTQLLAPDEAPAAGQPGDDAPFPPDLDPLEPAPEDPYEVHPGDDLVPDPDVAPAAEAGAGTLDPTRIDSGPVVPPDHHHDEQHPALIDRDHIGGEEHPPEPVFGHAAEAPTAPPPDAPIEPAPIEEPPIEEPPVEEPPVEDPLEETPEFLQDAPEHDRLWFEQKPPRDFDFGE
jgi:hypothetical protein